MLPFYLSQELTIDFFGADKHFKPATAFQMKSKTIPRSKIFFGTEYEVFQCFDNTDKEYRKHIHDLREDIQNGLYKIPLNIGYWKEFDGEFKPLRERIQPLRNRDKIRIFMLNGFGGGLGDNFLGITALRHMVKELKNYFKDVEIGLGQLFPYYGRDLLNKYPELIHSVMHLPISLQELQTYDAFIDFDSLLTREDFNGLPMVDFFLKTVGIDPDSLHPEEKRNQIKLAPNHKIPHFDEFIKDRKLILINPQSSRDIRTMPTSTFKCLCDYIIANSDYDLVSLTSFEYYHKRFYNFSAYSDNLENYIYMVSKMHGIITVDTFLVHLADAFSIPTVGLYLSIDPGLRVSYYPNAKGIFLNQEGKKQFQNPHSGSSTPYSKSLWDQLNHTEVMEHLDALIKRKDQSTPIQNDINFSTHMEQSLSPLSLKLSKMTIEEKLDGIQKMVDEVERFIHGKMDELGMDKSVFDQKSDVTCDYKVRKFLEKTFNGVDQLTEVLNTEVKNVKEQNRK